MLRTGYEARVYQDYKPCQVCGSEVRLSSAHETPRAPDPDGPVESRICTNPDCATNQAGDVVERPTP